jgi:hypothetical protein
MVAAPTKVNESIAGRRHPLRRGLAAARLSIRAAEQERAARLSGDELVAIQCGRLSNKLAELSARARLAGGVRR